MLEYAKIHACGNDFLIVAADGRSEDAQGKLAIALCARNTGVGADGVEFLTTDGPRSGVIRLRNADGSLAEISGNGTRCVAAWMAHRANATAGDTFTIETDAGPRACTLTRRDATTFQFRSSMGVPTVKTSSVFLQEQNLRVDGAIVSTGNPHFVIRVDSENFQVRGIDWRPIGHAICFHPQFPAQTNVEFIHVISPSEIAIRIFERGVGPTTSSGTGTCASAAAAVRLHGCERQLQVHAPGGSQSVTWASDTDEMQLTGPATLIAIGTAFLPQGRA